MTEARRVEVLVVGSGAGGAMTALELAAAGRDVCVVEEGARVGADRYARGSLDAFRHLYRDRGMTPILGRVPIGFVEGRCVGGGTEINSGFWHRAPEEALARWARDFGLIGASLGELSPHFARAEDLLEVSLHRAAWPKSTEILRRGADALGWEAAEVPRFTHGAGTKLIPLAEAAGAQVLPGCAVERVLFAGDRAVGAIASRRRADGATERLRLDADHVFLCGGARQTPALLRRSGAVGRAGDTLRIHPMLKVAAVFDEELDAHRTVLPLLQIKEFAPAVSLGGAFFSPGHLAMLLSDNWLENRGQMAQHRRIACYHVTVRGTGRGRVRPGASRYELSPEDVLHLSRGLAALCRLLFAAGARQIHPAVSGLPVIASAAEAARWRDEHLPRSRLSLTAVHAFSSCPAGERSDRCVVDSFGRVRGARNLYVNDASMLPDAPGVNPQGTIMALARRNALHFLEARP